MMYWNPVGVTLCLQAIPIGCHAELVSASHLATPRHFKYLYLPHPSFTIHLRGIEFIKKYGLLILFAGIAVFYYLRYKRAPNIASEEIVMQNSAGQQVNLSDELSGNTVVHFYATWCGPCMAEMRTIKSNYAALSAKGLQFIFITDDSADKISRVQADMPQGIRFYHIPSLKKVDIYSIPTTYFFNANKQITEKHLGGFAWTDEAEVDKLLAAMNR